MGLLSAIFGSKERPPEADEIETMRKSMLQVKAHGGAHVILKDFSSAFDEVRTPEGYRGFVLEDENMPRIAVRACALMVLSDIKGFVHVKGAPDASEVAKIEKAPDYAAAHKLFLDADEILPKSAIDGLREATMRFGEESFGHLGEPGFKERMMKSPVRMHVAELKRQSELEWQRWVRSGTRLKV